MLAVESPVESSVDVAQLSGVDLAAEIEMITALESQLTARKLALIGEWDARQEWRADGHVTGSSWLVQHCSQSRASAGALLGDARRLRTHPEVFDAIATIGATRARIVLRGATGRTADAFTRDATMLLAAAATLTVDLTTSLIGHWRRCADDGPEPVDDQGELTCSITGRTTVIHGTVTGIDGVLVHETIAAVAEELYRAEQASQEAQAPTTAAQRRARALVEICRRATATDPHTATPAPPLIMATVDLATLENRAGHTATPHGHIDRYGPITPAEARRLACDAHITRLITGPSSEILDLGRTSRTPNQAQRRAVRARDRGCAVPGCPAPPGWCDIHHIRFWIEHHGPTNLDNLIMLCHRHHTMTHNNQLTITTHQHQHVFRNANGTIMNPNPTHQHPSPSPLPNSKATWK